MSSVPRDLKGGWERGRGGVGRGERGMERGGEGDGEIKGEEERGMEERDNRNRRGEEGERKGKSDYIVAHVNELCMHSQVPEVVKVQNGV